MTNNKQAALIPVEHIVQSILILRGQRVLLDSELATLYQVQTKRLNEQVKRNIDRFPEDFMFRLSRAEVEVVNRSQNATGSQKHRDPRFPPYAFTAGGKGDTEKGTDLFTHHAITLAISEESLKLLASPSRSDRSNSASSSVGGTEECRGVVESLLPNIRIIMLSRARADRRTTATSIPRVRHARHSPVSTRIPSNCRATKSTNRHGRLYHRNRTSDRNTDTKPATRATTLRQEGRGNTKEINLCLFSPFSREPLGAAGAKRYYRGSLYS